jgi:hypothetical protein
MIGISTINAWLNLFFSQWRYEHAAAKVCFWKKLQGLLSGSSHTHCTKHGSSSTQDQQLGVQLWFISPSPFQQTTASITRLPHYWPWVSRTIQSTQGTSSWTCNCTSWCITSPKDLFAWRSSLACFASTLVVTKRREHHAHSASPELGLHHFYAWSSWRPTTTMHTRFVLVPLDWKRTSHTKMVAPTCQQWKTYSKAKLRSKQDGFQTQLHIES